MRCQVCEDCSAIYGNPCAGCQAGGMCDGWLAQCNTGGCQSERDRWSDDDRDWDSESEDEP